MPTSADRPRPRHTAEGGFTLLEIMTTVGLVAVVLLPILAEREHSMNRAYRATYMLRALHHAEEILAERARDHEQADLAQGWVEEDEAFRYEFTVKNYDLSTGRDEDEEDENDFGPNAPVDAGRNEPDEAEDRDDPHKVRRFKIQVYWPGLDDEEEEESIVLEGYLPRIWEIPLDDRRFR